MLILKKPNNLNLQLLFSLMVVLKVYFAIKTGIFVPDFGKGWVTGFFFLCVFQRSLKWEYFVGQFEWNSDWKMQSCG